MHVCVLQILNLLHSSGESFSSILLRFKKKLFLYSFFLQRHKKFHDLVKLHNHNKWDWILIHLKVKVREDTCDVMVNRCLWGEVGMCLCGVCAAVCCPGFNSAIHALLTLSYRADWVRVLGSKALCSSTAQPLLPSHLLLSSLRVICRLHTYTAYLSGSLYGSTSSCVSVRMCGDGWGRQKPDISYTKCFLTACFQSMHRKHSSLNVRLTHMYMSSINVSWM